MEMLRGAPVTAFLFGICIVVFLLAETTGNTRTNATLIRFGASERTLVWSGQYWRLATAMFLHIGPLHLLCNMWFGYRIAASAERSLGAWKFLALYLGSGVVGSAVSVIGHDALSAGASGALFGVIGWLLMMLRFQHGSWSAFWRNAAIRQQVIWIGAWFLIGTFMHFDNYAHGGGLLFGALFAWALTGPAGKRRGWRVAVLAWVGAVLVFAALRPLPFVHPPQVDVAPDGD
jgi:rhomboid protease GluP